MERKDAIDELVAIGASLHGHVMPRAYWEGQPDSWSHDATIAFHRSRRDASVTRADSLAFARVDFGEPEPLTDERIAEMTREADMVRAKLDHTAAALRQAREAEELWTPEALAEYNRGRA